MKVIQSINTWVKKSPVAALAATAAVVLLTTLALVNNSIQSYLSLSGLSEEDQLIAIIKRTDFQNPDYDTITVSFRNPTEQTKSVSDTAVICETYSGQVVQLPTANNHSPRPSFSVPPGEAKHIDLILLKHPDLIKINEDCENIRTAWTNSRSALKRGDCVTLIKGTAFMSQTVFNRPAMDDCI